MKPQGIFLCPSKPGLAIFSCIHRGRCIYDKNNIICISDAWNHNKGLCNAECKQQYDEKLYEKQEIIEEFLKKRIELALVLVPHEEHQAWDYDLLWLRLDHIYQYERYECQKSIKPLHIQEILR